MVAPIWTVGVLLYGDHHDLHKRCLGSIIDQINSSSVGIELRVGMNAVCLDTRLWLAEELFERPKCVMIPYSSDQNTLKYPMMRQMFCDEDAPLRSEYTMWWDDDSYIEDSSGWFDRVTEAFKGVDYMGSPYTMPLTANRRRWFNVQPWSNPKLKAGRSSPFMQGAWWCLRTELLQKFKYPFEGLEHRGGDVALGECARQNGWVTKRWREGVRINADQQGNESKAERRGFKSNLSWGDDYLGP